LTIFHLRIAIQSETVP